MNKITSAAARKAGLDTELDLGDRQVPLRLVVNRRAKRLIIKVDPVAECVAVTAPSKRSLPEAMRFARERVEWIRDRLGEGMPARPFDHNGDCPYRGVFHRIVNDGATRSTVRRIEGNPPKLIVGGEAAHLNRRLCDWLKMRARDDLTARVAIHASALGVRPRRIQVRDTRSRWGSCSPDGNLSFSWRLILAPSWVLDYVAAHESAHLLHMDHSAKYWRAVNSLGVDIEGARDWFDAHGQSLHAWGAKPASKSEA